MHKYLTLISLCFLLSSAKLVAQNDSLKAVETFAKGVEAFDAQKFDTVIALMNETLNLMKRYNFGSDEGLVRYFIAESYKSIGEYDLAKSYLESALKIFQSWENEAGFGYIYKCYGDIETLLGNYSQAVDYYYTSLQHLIVVEDPYTKGYVYTSLANLILNRGDNEEAAGLFANGEKLYRAADYEPGLGDIYYGYGLIATNTGKNVAADSLFDISLKIFSKFNIPLGVANAYYGKGIVTMNLGKNSESIGYSSKALDLYLSSNYPLGIGNCFTNIGMVNINIGKYEVADSNLRAAIPWLTKINHQIGLGNVHYGLAVIALNLGNNKESYDNYSQALKYYEFTGYSLGLGRIYHGLSTLALNTGDNKTAEENAKKAVEYYGKAGFPVGIGQVYENLGNIFMNAGNMPKSEENFKKALEYYEKANYPIGMGTIWFSLSQINFMKGDFVETRKNAGLAIKYFELAEYPLGLGNANFILSQIAQQQGNYTEGIDYDLKALDFYDKVNYPLGIGRVCYSIGTAAYLLGEYEEAEKQYKNALAVFEESEYNFFNVIVSFALADLYLGWDAREGLTLPYLEKAMSYLENFRSNLVREEDRTNLFEKFSVYLDFAVRAAITINNKEAAFRYLENVKGRSLADILSERKVDLSAKIDQSLLQKRNILEKQISAIKTALNTNAASDAATLKEELKKLNDQLDELIFKIKSGSPELAALEYPKPADTKEIQSKLYKNEVLLQYFIAESGCWVFVITPDDFQLVKLDSSDAAVRENALALLDGLKRDKFNAKKSKSEMDAEEELSLEASHKLYDLLIKPVESFLTSESDLTIVPDGILNLIPFETLTRDTTYLIEKHPVKYYQSGTLLSLMRGALKKERKSSGFAGFGDPVYDIENFEKGMEERGVKPGDAGRGTSDPEANNDLSRAGLSLFRLRGTGEEITAISELFANAGQPVDIKLRTSATEENAKDTNLKNFRYISFACHGIVYPGFQSLALCTVKDSTKSSQDGFLTFEEILALNWDAKMVVLSACETGTGDMKKTEGIIGLTRAVMYAGSDAVLVSLWTVSDKGTRDLMINFFGNIVSESIPTDQCLRLAKLELIKKGATPYVWSPFIMFGE